MTTNANFSAAPDPPADWNLLSWAKGTGAHRVVADAIALRAGSEDKIAALKLLRGLKSRDELASVLNTAAVMESLIDAVWGETARLQQAPAATNDEITGKFAGISTTLHYEGLDTFFGGLEGIVGTPSPRPLQGMAAEHLDGLDSTDWFVTGNYGVHTKSKIEWLFVTDATMTPAKLGLNAWPAEPVEKLPDRRRCRKRQPLDDIKRKAKERNACLKEGGHSELIIEELIAAIMYTGPVRPCLARHTLLALHAQRPMYPARSSADVRQVQRSPARPPARCTVSA